MAFTPRPVTIRGVRYPSMSAAARALGVGNSAIWGCAKRGTLETVGLYPLKYTAIIAALARAAPEDLPNLRTQAQIWLDYQIRLTKRKRK